MAVAVGGSVRTETLDKLVARFIGGHPDAMIGILRGTHRSIKVFVVTCITGI